MRPRVSGSDHRDSDLARGVADGIVAALLRSFPQGVTGIRLQTPDALALQILNRAGKFPRVASPGDRRLAMLAAAAEIRDERLNTPAIAVALERSYRDIRDSGVTLGAFRQNRERSGDKKRATEIADACGATNPSSPAAPHRPRRRHPRHRGSGRQQCE